jgi:enoyl-CoA hydratase/carnithine racemase
MALLIALATILLLLAPSEALAWGIGVHLQIGSHLLGNLSELPPALQALLSAHPHDFLYGCISADITLGKKFTHYLQHCHSWRLGKKVLTAAETDAQKACAYGYLAHLAADTVAHSYFVPFKMARTFNTALLKHTYWEMRVESGVPPETWALARTIARKDFPRNDAMLRRVLSDTIFSFGTNKRLFNSLLLLTRLQQWQKMLRSFSTASKWSLDEKDREEYLALAGAASQGVLAGMEQSPFWRADPTGERAINAARMIRKNLNLLWLDGKLPATEAEAILAELKIRFRDGITKPDQILEMLSEF